ncbi:hypothetical protein [Streptomyces sp. A1-5]|uniref:hypothetical protein n=1 Tax=Streptomyces sp. A1-5 TaxID=2738410 RepID=UPI001F3A062F|nr:hypothetical protein [Streptomyces sp. A1-5]UJB40507.1 hypothetical protein HRD51_06380 [Streptomyces sp. A1-5]
MRELTFSALNSCLAASGVPERDWDTVTGGSSQETGWCYTTVNHYRAGGAGRTVGRGVRRGRRADGTW